MMMMMSQWLQNNAGQSPYQNNPYQQRNYNRPPLQFQTQNYLDTINTADLAQYGGNTDGKVDRAELSTLQQVWDNSARSTFQQAQTTGNPHLQNWSNYYALNSAAAQNLSQFFSVFASADPSVTNGITAKGLTTMAGYDGNTNTLSGFDVRQQIQLSNPNSVQQPYGVQQPYPVQPPAQPPFPPLAPGSTVEAVRINQERQGLVSDFAKLSAFLKTPEGANAPNAKELQQRLAGYQQRDAVLNARLVVLGNNPAPQRTSAEGRQIATERIGLATETAKLGQLLTRIHPQSPQAVEWQNRINMLQQRDVVLNVRLGQIR